ncbi:MAG: hypothetical protein IJ047_07770 [Paludibacteraceae bacterium]|nr:hypothetical protein [Paludibacteraceae bacterium]
MRRALARRYLRPFRPNLIRASALPIYTHDVSCVRILRLREMHHYYQHFYISQLYLYIFLYNME